MAPRMSAEERRLAILQKSVPLFAQHGFNGVTTRMLAKAAGVSEALLYRHFPSKEAIFEELKNFCHADTTLQETERIKQLKPSTSTLVYTITMLISEIYKGSQTASPEGVKHEDLHRMMVNSFLEDGQFAKLFISGNCRVWEDIILESIHAAKEAGDLVEGCATPNMAMWLAHHLPIAVRLHQLPEETIIDYQTPQEDILDNMLRFALRGIGLRDEVIKRHYNPEAWKLLANRS